MEDMGDHYLIDGMGVNNDPTFVDAFDFLLAGQTSTMYTDMDGIMHWGDDVSAFDGNMGSTGVFQPSL